MNSGNPSSSFTAVNKATIGHVLLLIAENDIEQFRERLDASSTEIRTNLVNNHIVVRKVFDERNLEFFRELVRYGFRVNQKFTAMCKFRYAEIPVVLILAKQRKSHRLLKHLVREAGVSVNLSVRCDVCGATPLLASAAAGSGKCYKILRKEHERQMFSNEEIRQSSSRGLFTPLLDVTFERRNILMLACKSDSIEIAMELHRNDRLVMAKLANDLDMDGNVAFHFARSNYIARFLLACKAEQPANRFGITPAMRAARKGIDPNITTVEYFNRDGFPVENDSLPVLLMYTLNSTRTAYASKLQQIRLTNSCDETRSSSSGITTVIEDGCETAKDNDTRRALPLENILTAKCDFTEPTTAREARMLSPLFTDVYSAIMAERALGVDSRECIVLTFKIFRQLLASGKQDEGFEIIRELLREIVANATLRNTRETARERLINSNEAAVSDAAVHWKRLRKYYKKFVKFCCLLRKCLLRGYSSGEDSDGDDSEGDGVGVDDDSNILLYATARKSHVYVLAEIINAARTLISTYPPRRYATTSECLHTVQTFAGSFGSKRGDGPQILNDEHVLGSLYKFCSECNAEGVPMLQGFLLRIISRFDYDDVTRKSVAKLIETLISLDANIDLRDTNGRTALSVALYFPANLRETIETLLRNTKDIDAYDCDGYSVLETIKAKATYIEEKELFQHTRLKCLAARACCTSFAFLEQTQSLLPKSLLYFAKMHNKELAKNQLFRRRVVFHCQ